MVYAFENIKHGYILSCKIKRDNLQKNKFLISVYLLFRRIVLNVLEGVDIQSSLCPLIAQ